MDREYPNRVLHQQVEQARKQNVPRPHTERITDDEDWRIKLRLDLEGKSYNVNVDRKKHKNVAVK